MGGILAFLIMEEIDLIKKLEKISFQISNRLLKLQGNVLKGNYKENLEIIIYRGFSSSTTHKIEIDSEKKVIALDYYFTKFKLYKAPLSNKSVKPLIEKESYHFFLNQKNWI